MATIPTFDSAMALWNDRYQEGMGNKGTDPRALPDFIRKRATLEMTFNAMLPLGKRYIDLTLGNIGPASGSPLCFLMRLEKKFANQLAPEVRDQFEQAVTDIFFLGIATDFVCLNRDYGTWGGNLDVDEIGKIFFQDALVANKIKTSFPQDFQNISTLLIAVQWQKIQPLIKKNLGIGFFNRPKFESNFENVFMGGILLSIMVNQFALGRPITFFR